jgi:2-polyprenyl-3-methyl-5-hydroxy-6-metoxy-1,4-benzoquinol methylase
MDFGGYFMDNSTPWQLRLFKKTLKKKLKLKNLERYLDGHTATKNKCLLLTCGDNNGALNYFLRELGGEWIWAEMELDQINQIEDLLNEKVVHIDQTTCKFPFSDSFFDTVVIIDSHEHLKDPSILNRELSRVTKANGKVVVSVPNGDETKLAVKIKRMIGMTEEVYGHVVVGYEVEKMNQMLQDVGFAAESATTYSKFFTEMLELIINFAYVKVLGRRKSVEVESGTIAPTSEQQLKSVSKVITLYALIYPVFWLISKLDALLFFTTGYAVVVSARKE